MANELYFEDLYAGRRFKSERSYKVTAEEIKEFAERYDPQPFHLDEAAGERLVLQGAGGLGLADGGDRDAAAGGVDPRGRRHDRRGCGGDALDASGAAWRFAADRGGVLEVRRSSARTAYGVVRSRTTVFNQKDEIVMRSMVNFLAPLRRP